MLTLLGIGHFPCFYSDRYICVREDEHLLLGQNEVSNRIY